MSAPTLFDAPETQGRSRKSDPQTSVEAAKTVKAGTQRAQVLAAMRAVHPRGVTADALAAWYPSIHRSTWSSRLAGLERSGHVKVLAIAKNDRGRSVQVFELTDKGRR